MTQTMLYKYPGPHDIHGSKFDYVIVNDEDIDAHIGQGWSLTTAQALEAASKPPVNDDDAPTRAELETKARELNIKFSDKTSDDKLGSLIESRLSKAAS